MKLPMAIVSWAYQTVKVIKLKTFLKTIQLKGSIVVGKKKDCCYLNDIDLFSAIIPDLKLLVIPFYIFCNAHSAHLFQNRKEEARIW